MTKKNLPYVAGGGALVLLIWDPFRWRYDALTVYIILWVLVLSGWFAIIRSLLMSDHALQRQAPVSGSQTEQPPQIPDQKPAPSPEMRSVPPQDGEVRHYVKIQAVSDAMKKRLQDTIYGIKHELIIPFPDDSVLQLVMCNGGVWLESENDKGDIRSIHLEPNCIYPIYRTVNRNDIVVLRLTILQY